MPNPVELGRAASTEGAGAQTTVITTSVAHTAGNPIIVGFATNKNITSVTDSAGNTYSQIVMAGGGPRIYMYRSSGAIALASGGTITITTGGLSASSVVALAVTTPGYQNATDATGTGSGASGEPSVTIDPVVGNALQIGFINQNTNAVSGTAVPDPDWTLFGEAVVEGTNSFTLTAAYRVRTDGASDTWNPTTDLSVAWQAIAASQGPVGGESNLLTLGVS